MAREWEGEGGRERGGESGRWRDCLEREAIYRTPGSKHRTGLVLENVLKQGTVGWGKAQNRS